MSAPSADDLVREYAPLTGAEADVVLARLGDREVGEVVAEVKLERGGPAATWEDVPEIVSPVADEIAAVRVALDEASQKRIRDAGNDSDRALNEAARLKAHLDEINAYILGHVAEVTEEADRNVLSDDDLASASAADLVAHLKAQPEEADRIEAVENGREHPRKSVLDAVADARGGGS